MINLFAVGKSQNPRAFKNVKQIPVDYVANKKACLRRGIFEEWLKKLDSKMGKAGRKIAMIVDNCTAHPHVELDNIELFFLPPNTTSHTQPMDANIIRNLKCHYRRILSTRRLQAAEQNTDMKWDLLDCLLAVRFAWGMVTDVTIRNCYRKVQFVSEDIEEAPPEATTSHADDNEREFRNIRSRLEQMLGDIPSMNDYVDIDTECQVTTVLTDQEIIEEIRERNSTDGPALQESTEPEPMPMPTGEDAFKAVDCIRRFTLSSSSDKCDEILRLSEMFEKLV